MGGWKSLSRDEQHWDGTLASTRIKVSAGGEITGELASTRIKVSDGGEITGDVTLDGSLDMSGTATNRIRLPIGTTLASPTLAFGTVGNTGIWASTNSIVWFTVNGTNIFSLKSAGLTMGSGARMRNINASATVPSFVASSGDDDTGTGSAGADQWSAIAGGVEGLRVSESAGAITHGMAGKVYIGDTTTAPDNNLHIGTTTAGQGAHIGDAFVGNWDGNADYASFMHNDLKATNASACLTQYNDGTTYLNAASSKTLHLQIGGTDYATIDGTAMIVSGGDFYFSGSGTGLPHGLIHGTDETVTCTDQNTWYQVTFDTVGVQNLITGSAANNDMTISKTGVYKYFATICFHSAASHDFEFQIKRNNGTSDITSSHVFQTTAVAGRVENTSMTTHCDGTATDTVELWVRCTDAAGIDCVMDHNNLGLSMIGG